MPIKRRRRIAVLITILASLGIGLVAALAAAIGDTERISSYWISGTLTEDGLLVTEVIDYDFGDVPVLTDLYIDGDEIVYIVVEAGCAVCSEDPSHYMAMVIVSDDALF